METYGKDSTITTLLDKLDFYVLPVINIDGYVYTWTNVSTFFFLIVGKVSCQNILLVLIYDPLQDRMWRKTRSKNAGSICYGTDPNRNFDAGWCSKCLLKRGASNYTQVQ